MIVKNVQRRTIKRRLHDRYKDGCINMHDLNVSPTLMDKRYASLPVKIV